MEALRAATAVAAQAMRVDKDLGTIETGKRADLLVLDANPLDNISNVRTVRFVMKDGRVFDSAALWTAAGFAP
jgi:imidazolonepropionase-like amidohydrolase